MFPCIRLFHCFTGWCTYFIIIVLLVGARLKHPLLLIWPVPDLIIIYPKFYSDYFLSENIIEPHREKTGFLPIRKQRRRPYREADKRFCFRYTDSTISLLLKSEVSMF